MEYHVTLTGPHPDLAAIAAALHERDPAAVLDLAPSTGTLRIAAALGVQDIAALLAAARHPVEPGAIRPQPSVCCGGCSG